MTSGRSTFKLPKSQQRPLSFWLVMPWTLSVLLNRALSFWRISRLSDKLRERVAGRGVVERPIRAGKLAGIAEMLEGFLIEAVAEDGVIPSKDNHQSGHECNTGELQETFHSGLLIRVVFAETLV